MKMQAFIIKYGLKASAAFFLAAGLHATSTQVLNKPSGTLQPAESRIFLREIDGTRGVHVPFSIRNTSTDRVYRILGCDGRCGPEGCINAPNLPLTIPPSESAIVDVEIRTPHSSGGFSLTISLVTDSPDFPTIPLEVCGVVVSSAPESLPPQ